MFAPLATSAAGSRCRQQGQHDPLLGRRSNDGVLRRPARIDARRPRHQRASGRRWRQRHRRFLQRDPERASRERHSDAATKIGMTPIPVFTYLANTLRIRDREVPYSLITATDLGALNRKPASGGSAPLPDGRSGRSIYLNDWTARELAAHEGDELLARLLPLGRERRPDHEDRELPRRRHRADPGSRRGSSTRAGISRDHRCGECRRVGSALSDGSLEGPSAGREVLGRTPHDAEGVHRL